MLVLEDHHGSADRDQAHMLTCCLSVGSEQGPSRFRRAPGFSVRRPPPKATSSCRRAGQVHGARLAAASLAGRWSSAARPPSRRPAGPSSRRGWTSSASPCPRREPRAPTTRSSRGSICGWSRTHSTAHGMATRAPGLREQHVRPVPRAGAARLHPARLRGDGGVPTTSLPAWPSWRPTSLGRATYGWGAAWRRPSTGGAFTTSAASRPRFLSLEPLLGPLGNLPLTAGRAGGVRAR